MEEKSAEEIMWANSNKIAVDQLQQEDDDEEEALSLSDLPLIHQWRKDRNDDEEEESSRSPIEVKEDFDFCSVSKDSEMCAADELFFKGRILPLRHSVSSEKGLLLRSISRSESMDRCYSGGLISSRSSSISSHHSMTSSSSSGGSGSAAAVRRPKLPPRNQFHSHPSPSPRLHFPTNKQKIVTRNYSIPKSSPPWNIFRLGLVAAPPEIAYQDLKTRNNNNFGSRNSTSSSISSGSDRKKKKARANLLGGCKCSSDAVDTVTSRVVFIKRCASEGDVEKALLDIQRKSNSDTVMMTTKQAAKKRLSHHRTFEWLKQLSLEQATADDS